MTVSKKVRSGYRGGRPVEIDWDKVRALRNRYKSAKEIAAEMGFAAVTIQKGMRLRGIK